MGVLEFPDVYDWRGCKAVQFDPEKLSGRATVGATRMFADGVLENYLEGLTVDEIVESYGLEKSAVHDILAFAAAKDLKATA